MSTLTPFGTISYGSDLKDWIGAHAIRHRAEGQEAARRGTPLSLPMLDGQIDSDWFGRHARHHQGMCPYGGTQSTYTLSSGWHDEKSFYDWHRIHTLLHQQLDHVLGMTG